MTISESIYNEGLDVGYSRIGASKLSTLKSYPTINKLKLEYPWAKSIIIGVWHYNIYKIPDQLKGIVNKEDLFQGRYLKGSHENETATDLEAFFNENKLKYSDVFNIKKNVKNEIAEQMEIGVIRKNGYFYTEEGSYSTLHVWLLDEDVEWRHEEAPAVCLNHCSICIRTCPEKALEMHYVKDHDKCIVSISNKVSFPDINLKTVCDHCQDVCPFNKHRWTNDELFLTLEY